MDVIELLEHDHRLIRQLIEQLEESDDPTATRSLFAQVGHDLAVHEAIEQQVLFPAFAVALAANGDTTLDRRMGEHDEMNELLAEMRTLSPDGFGFAKRASALLLEANNHFQFEEDSVFMRMRSEMSEDELEALATQALAVKQHASTLPDSTTESV